ncbi:hypothetical protein GCM10023165_51230 [Variovorax defluvii]|uniref:Uncharacterized protein n=2 Tax=Variovorax defluvii TaxID=913761 RepID=A0ABP8IES0_9BURK
MTNPLAEDRTIARIPEDQATQTGCLTSVRNTASIYVGGWKLWQKAAALSGIAAGFVGITVATLYSKGYFDPDNAPQAHTRMTNYIKGCLEQAGITNIDPSQLASDVLGFIKANWQGVDVEKKYATTPDWEHQVPCPDPDTYYGHFPDTQTSVFVDAVNDVLLTSLAAIARPAQILLFASLLIGALNNLPPM